MSNQKKRANTEDIAAIMADCEEAMVTLRSSYRVEQYMMQKHKLGARQVQRYMSKVRKAWRAKASLENREDRRDNIRETLATILRTALTRTELVKNDAGQTVFAMERGPNGEERRRLDSRGFPIPMTRPKPDLQRALHACNQLRHLDALDEPFKAKLIIDAELEAMPDLKAMSPEGFEKLRDVLVGAAPGGDLRKLAGSLFTGSGGMSN
jgi:hypothetical protein